MTRLGGYSSVFVGTRVIAGQVLAVGDQREVCSSLRPEYTECLEIRLRASPEA